MKELIIGTVAFVSLVLLIEVSIPIISGIRHGIIHRDINQRLIDKKEV